MKLFLILFLLFPFNLFAMDYYIVPDKATGLPVVIGSNKTPQDMLYESPKDDGGKHVRDFQDISLIKINTLSCSGSADCSNKSIGLCDSVSNSKSIIASDFSETYCASPRFSASKRAARVANIQAGRDAEKAKTDLFNAKIIQIKAACDGANGLTKLMCEYMSRNE